MPVITREMLKKAKAIYDRFMLDIENKPAKSKSLEDWVSDTYRYVTKRDNFNSDVDFHAQNLALYTTFKHIVNQTGKNAPSNYIKETFDNSNFDMEFQDNQLYIIPDILNLEAEQLDKINFIDNTGKIYNNKREIIKLENIDDEKEIVLNDEAIENDIEDDMYVSNGVEPEKDITDVFDADLTNEDTLLKINNSYRKYNKFEHGFNNMLKDFIARCDRQKAFSTERACDTIGMYFALLDTDGYDNEELARRLSFTGLNKNQINTLTKFRTLLDSISSIDKNGKIENKEINEPKQDKDNSLDETSSLYDIDIKKDNPYDKIKKDNLVRKSLDSLREARANYAQHNIFARITAHIIGLPKAVAEEIKFINRFKQKLLDSGMSQDIIDITKASVDDERYDRYMDYALPDSDNLNYDMLVEANNYNKEYNPNREFDNKSTSSDYTYLEDDDLKSEDSYDSKDLEFEEGPKHKDLFNLAKDTDLFNESGKKAPKQSKKEDLDLSLDESRSSIDI